MTDQPAPRLTSRRYGATGHGYLIDGDNVPGVTTITDVLPKQLKQWASDAAANYAVDHWEELAGLTVTKRVDRIRYAHRDLLSEAALRGTRIHGFGEKLLHGEAVDIPDEYRTASQAYARFLDAWQIEPLVSEVPVGHTVYRYGGRLDAEVLIGRRDNARAILDLKSGKSVYESAVQQLAGYRYADIWQPDGPESEEARPEVDLVYVAHIKPDSVDMLPVQCGAAEFRAFLYTKEVYQWLKVHGWRGPEPLIGAPTHPEGRDEW